MLSHRQSMKEILPPLPHIKQLSQQDAYQTLPSRASVGAIASRWCAAQSSLSATVPTRHGSLSKQVTLPGSSTEDSTASPLATIAA